MSQGRYDVRAVITHRRLTEYTDAEKAQRAEAGISNLYLKAVYSEETVDLIDATLASRSTSGQDHGHGYTVHVYTATTGHGTILEVGTKSYIDFAKDGQMLINGYGIKEDREDFSSWQRWTVRPARACN
jgi:hypothetical protein